MKYKIFKKKLKDSNLKLSVDNNGIDYILFFIRNNKLYYENHFFDGEKKLYPLTKKEFKELVIDEKFLFKVEKPRNNSQESIMKMSFFRELALNHTGSIITEYAHSDLSSRADFAVFQDGEIYVYELKSDADSLSRLKQQVKDYKTYADVITVVLNEKHLNAFNKLGLDVNLIIERNNRYEIVDISKRNSPDKRFNLLWYKERENLFKGLSGNSKYSLTQKTQRLRKSDLDLNRLTALVLEDRYKNVSDICRGNSIEMFKKREFAPSNKNLLHFGFNFSL